jgi:Spy/CpxP family protein refolding chaperone
MKIISLHRFIFIALLVFTASVYAPAQNRPSGPPPDDAPDAVAGPLRRPDLLRELGLSTDQLQQLRRLNRERKPLMEQAAQRLREANRNLDAVIYADNLDENEVQVRLKEFQSAQAEIARLRIMGELQVRRVLTPEQLIKFRELRARFAATIETQREKRRLTRRLRNGAAAPATPTKPN